MANSSSKSGVSQKSGIGKQGAPKTPEEALANANAANYNKERGYQVNCQRVVWAYELQRRGYDVEALPNYDNLGYGTNWHSIVDGKVDRIGLADNLWQKTTNAKNAKKATEIMAQWGEGSRAAIRFSRARGGGHVFNVEYKNGKIEVFEAQTGRRPTSLAKYLTEQKAHPNYVEIFRTDNLKFNNSEIPKYVKKRGS